MHNLSSQRCCKHQQQTLRDLNCALLGALPNALILRVARGGWLSVLSESQPSTQMSVPHAHTKVHSSEGSLSVKNT